MVVTGLRRASGQAALGRFGVALALWAVGVAAACSPPTRQHGPGEVATSHEKLVGGSASPPTSSQLGPFLHGQLKVPPGTIRKEIAPRGAHLTYFGGRVVSNMEVVVVLYGDGSYIPEVTGNTSGATMASFYQNVVAGPYVDWLSEYNTTDESLNGTGQTIGRGTLSTQIQITPSDANNGTIIDDTNIQAELASQIQAGNLPAPSHDALGNNNTYYAIFFPHGKVITEQGASSCSYFCAYHGTLASSGSAGEVYYGVHPDMQSGSGCEFGCGQASSVFGNYTQVASHELVETITDPEVGLATVFGPPLAWYDQGYNAEISDLCVGDNGQVVGGDGVTYDVQTAFSNSQNDCIVTGPYVDPVLISPVPNACGVATVDGTVTLLGGATGFRSPVTLSLISVSPTPPAGGEITATFDPNPVGTPPAVGVKVTMHIQSSPTTPAGKYTLTVQGASAEVTATATTTFEVFTVVPVTPTPISPADGADGVSRTPKLTWVTDSLGALYTLDLFAGKACTGTPVHTYQSSHSPFVVPDADALDSYSDFSWRVTAANVCGPDVSPCASFRTESCAESEGITNGGFESGLKGWSSDSIQPPPVVTSEQPHSGTSALRLGTTTGSRSSFGASSVSQIVTLPAGSTSNLAFWMWGSSTDPFFFDQQFVTVTPIQPPGQTTYLLTVNDRAQTYGLRQLSLAAYAGQTVRLTFGVLQYGFGGGTTGMYIDDVSVGVASCGPPDFALRVYPVKTGEACAGSSVDFNVAVDSIHGPNFTSLVNLGTANLPPGTSATFAANSIGPGQTTVLTLHTTRPIIGKTYPFTVTGVAVTPPPGGTHSATANVLLDANPPAAPPIVSPKDGEINLPRRPTLSWTAPFVPDAGLATARAPWGPLAARRLAPSAPRLGVASPGATPDLVPFAFGASSYHVQVARDAAFTQIVVEADVATNTFTVPIDLDVAQEYFWRVNATNVCGVSPYSKVSRFLVGACSEGWGANPPYPESSGVALASLVPSPSNGKLYLIGGVVGYYAQPSDEVWSFDPSAGVWTQKASVPAPGIGETDGGGVELGGTIYLFGGYGNTGAHRFLWKYNVAADSWSRGRDLPSDNFGSAVAVVAGKIYIAYGSGLGLQTLQYDPVADTYQSLSPPPSLATPYLVRAVTLNGEMHVLGGDDSQDAHVIYDPRTDTWRTGPSLLPGIREPAVGVIGGRAIVVGGYPTTRTEIFDPVANAWSEGPPISGSPQGFDYSEGATIGGSFHVVGGFDGSNTIAAHWRLHLCQSGNLSSANILPLVVDGNGTVAGVSNERTALVLDNVSGNDMQATCVLYGQNGGIDSSLTVSVAANEAKAIPDIIRAIRRKTGLQNFAGNLTIFGTEIFHAMGSLVANDTSDNAYEDGVPLSGHTAGFVPVIRSKDYKTQTVFSNLSSSTALLQLVVYPPEGGDAPAVASLVPIKPHATVSYPDIATQLGLARGTIGQLSWSANQPMAVVARERLPTRSLSGFEPVRLASDAGSLVTVPYVEDTAAFSTSLDLSNPGSSTADVTINFIDGTTGVVSSRDLQVEFNSAVPIPDIVRWVLRSTSAQPTGERGFLTIETPQGVTAHGRLIDRANNDPAVTDQLTALDSAFSPLLIRIEPFTGLLAKTASANLGEGGVASGLTSTAASTPATVSRFAVSNPNDQPAMVEITALNASGSAAGPPYVVTIPAKHQYFTENLIADMGLPVVFLGSVNVRSDAPVLVYNHRRTGDLGATVPVHGL